MWLSMGFMWLGYGIVWSYTWALQCTGVFVCVCVRTHDAASLCIGLCIESYMMLYVYRLSYKELG